MTPFQEALHETLKFEGGYVNNPADPGGETNYGVTKVVAIANGYTGDMKLIPMGVVEQIYKAKYWDGPGFNKIADNMPELAKYLFDIGVNCGPVTASKFLQIGLTALGQTCDADGVIGPGTLKALWDLPAKFRPTLRGLIAIQHGQRYMSIIERKPTQRQFINGWLKRVRWTT